jgi:hypothetical protein
LKRDFNIPGKIMYQFFLAFGVIISMSVTSSNGFAEEKLPPPVGWHVPEPSVLTPGVDYIPPIDTAIIPSEAVPQVYENSGDAGPDQTFFAIGSGFTEEIFVWGRDGELINGRRWEAKPHLVKENYLAATFPERSYDSVFLVWIKNQAGWSHPFRLNVPQPWWSWPKQPVPGQEVRIFGRDMARRPDRTTAFVYLAQPGAQGRWLEILKADKYTVTIKLPQELVPGSYKLWFHAGSGGKFGWADPLDITIRETPKENGEVLQLLEHSTGDDKFNLRKSIEELAAKGGGILKLGSGTYNYRGTLKIPAGIVLEGAGIGKTILQVEQGGTQDFVYSSGGGWNQAPGKIHTPGDIMEYGLNVPMTGKWNVWVRYATDMSPWNQPGVSGNMVLQVDDGDPIPLENLPNTGSFGNFKWSLSATLDLMPGEHKLQWKNVKGGGISLDAFVLALDQDYSPGDNPFPETDDGVLVIQGEDVVKFETASGVLPGRINAAVWLSGDDAGIRELTVSGNPQIGDGVLIQSDKPLKWVNNCHIKRCRISDIESKYSEICGVRLVKANSAVVVENEIWGRAPLFLSGIKQCNLSDNRLVSVTRFGGNSEAAILGRTEVMEECIIENNVVDSSPGAEAGGPQARRLIWVSTGRGSVTKNWFAGNGVVESKGPGSIIGAGPMRFGGVAGTDQNVGEMILFEANHRTMYFGPLAGAGEEYVLLPKTIPSTPDNLLGGVKREELAHDSEGNETPFWPPDKDDGSQEPPITEYYVSVFKGPGQGQTRRVVAREGELLLLDRPWNVPPTAGCIVAVGTGFYRNLVVGNYTPDGMTGIQLWISCMENIVSANSIARMRRPAFFLYSNGTNLASSMPRTWNRGISPLFFNHIEGNRAVECSAGVLLTSGDDGKIPIEFPRALGNVIRNNSFDKNRTEGVIIVSRKGNAADGDTAPSILGTIVEFNVVRDAPIAYHSSHGSDGVLFRRNHAYFWYPVNNSTEPLVGFQIDKSDADVVLDNNDVEGKVGEMNPKYVIDIKKPE